MIARRHNFTLIEILVVVVLISLLVGITVPAYTKIMTGNAVSYSARIITSQLNMARVEACAKRKNVAVVFLNEKNFSYKQDELGIFNRRAYRACYVTGNSSPYTFDAWVPGTKWEVLPNGAFFAAETQDGMSEMCTINAVKDDYKTTRDSSGNIIATQSANIIPDGPLENAVVFDKTGRSEKASKIVIVEGKVNSNDSLATLKDDSASLRKPNTANWAIVTVNQYTGKTKVEMPEE